MIDLNKKNLATYCLVQMLYMHIVCKSKWIGLINSVVPLCCSAYWDKDVVETKSHYAKYFAVYLTTTYSSIVRIYPNLMNQQLLHILFALNIAWAGYEDIVHNKVLNGISGLLLSFLAPKSYVVRDELLLLNTSKLFILAYSIWNFTFAYGGSLGYDTFPRTGTILFPNYLYCVLTNENLWILCRGTSLSLHLTMMAFTNGLRNKVDQIKPLYSNILSVASFITSLCLGCDV